MVAPVIDRVLRSLLLSLNRLAAILWCVAQRPMMTLLAPEVWWLMLT